MKEKRLRKIIHEEVKRTLSESVANDNLRDMGYDKNEIEDFDLTVEEAYNALNSLMVDLQSAERELKVLTQNVVDSLPHDVQVELSKDSPMAGSDMLHSNIFYALNRADRDFGDLTKRLDKITRAIEQILNNMQD